MPLYSFYSEKLNEYRDVFFHMVDEKVYSGEDGSEKDEWRRVYTVPQMNVDTQLDPNDKNQFIRRAEKYKTIGSLIDKSRELSDIRAQRNEIDPQKRAFFDKYTADRGGNKKHIQDRPSVIENARVKIELD